jgi:teichuronic acid biosynthesis glycosyltransferase TuaC
VRVLVVTNMYPSPERPALGGFVRDQVEALRELRGLEVEVFAFAGGGARAYARAARALRARHRGGRFDVVHAHYGLSGWVALALGSGPLVVTFHGTDLAHRAVGPASRALARVIDLPATLSASLARSGDGPHRAGRERRVAVLPCGADLDRFAPRDRRAARAAVGLDPDGPLLLFPGDPRRAEKRHDRAAALAQAARARLLTYEGVAPSLVPSYVNAADAVVATSEREGFGLAPLEALASDVPVLSTPVGIAPLVLSGVEGTLCAPFDEARWLAALRPHLEARDPRVEGRAHARMFERRRMAERVACAYRELAGVG